MNRKGFTLIELLVVISIIAVLASLGAVSYSGAQTRARDNQRKVDLHNLAKALDLYYLDNKSYPSGYRSLSVLNSSYLKPYLKGPVHDPKSGLLGSGYVLNDLKNSAYYSYIYWSDGTKTYLLFAHLENTNDPETRSKGFASSCYPSLFASWAAPNTYAVCGFQNN